MTTFILAVLLIVVLLASWALTLLGMPGNWLMLLVTVIYASIVPAASRAAIGWKVILALAVLAILGEVVELLAAAAGTARAGGSRRGAIMALLGSIVGGLFGLLVGAPVPLIGSLVGVLLFAGVGAAVGATIGEVSAGKDMATTWRISKAAFWGRLAGTLGKIIVGAVMLTVAAAALLLH